MSEPAKNPLQLLNKSTQRFAYGCMRAGGSWDDTPIGVSDFSRTDKIFIAAIDAGIKLFDHADIYTHGKSEKLFGQFLKARPSMRQRIILQSKCGVKFENATNASPYQYDLSYQHIVSSAEASLKRLNTNHLDIYLLHRPDPLMIPEEVARAFDHLHSSGKVRHFGVSNFNVPQLRLLQSAIDQSIITNQIELSLQHHAPISDCIDGENKYGILEYCQQHDIQIQAWSPLAGGNASKEQSEVLAEKLSELAEKYGQSNENIMLAWLLRHPAGILPVIGSTQAARIADMVQAAKIKLSRDEWYGLLAAARKKVLP